MKKRKPGQPRKETKFLQGRVNPAAFDALAADARKKGYIVFQGTQRESVAWGEYLSAIAAAVISGRCDVRDKFKERP